MFSYKITEEPVYSETGNKTFLKISFNGKVSEYYETEMEDTPGIIYTLAKAAINGDGEVDEFKLPSALVVGELVTL